MKHRTSIFRPLALTFLMALPFGFGVAFLGAGIYEGWREFKHEVLGVDGWGSYHNHLLGFLADGTPVVRDHKTVGGWQWQDQHTHLDGTPITSNERAEILHPQQLRNNSSRHRPPFGKAPLEDLLSDRNRWRGFRDPEKGSIQWTWEPVEKSSTGRILVARYRASDTAVWFVTPDGFVPGALQFPKSVRGFQLPEDWKQEEEMVAVQSAGKLTAINLVDQTVVTITDVDVSRQAWSMFRQNDETGWRFAIQTPDAIRIYSDRGEQLFAHATEKSGDGQPDFYTPTNGGFIVTHVESRHEERLPDDGRRIRTDLIATWLDESGEVTRTLKFQNEFRNEPARSSSALVNSIDQFIEKAEAGLALPEPVVICGGVFIVVPWLSSYYSPNQSSSKVIEEILTRMPYAIPVSVLVALCCAIACWRRQQKYQADWTKTWVVFVFMFGLPAWIAWRVHRRWPPLELATASAADFVGPEPNGLEIR